MATHMGTVTGTMFKSKTNLTVPTTQLAFHYPKSRHLERAETQVSKNKKPHQFRVTENTQKCSKET